MEVLQSLTAPMYIRPEEKSPASGLPPEHDRDKGNRDTDIPPLYVCGIIVPEYLFPLYHPPNLKTLFFINNELTAKMLHRIISFPLYFQLTTVPIIKYLLMK